MKMDFDRLSQSIDDLVKTYYAIVNFLEIVSNLFPLDLVLVLIFSIPLLLVFNSLSPSSPRINYTLAVLLVSGIRTFLQHSISQSWEIFAVSKTALILLLPAYAFLLIRLLFERVQKLVSRKKALSPRNLEESFGALQSAYRTLSIEIYSELDSVGGGPIYRKSKFLPALKELEEATVGMRRLLEKRKITENILNSGDKIDR